MTPSPSWYVALGLFAIVASAVAWSRLVERDPVAGSTGGAAAANRVRRGELAMIYFAGLAGGLIGAKLAFLLAEGWPHRTDWIALATGRSVTGALLGGYATVELMKRLLGVRGATGDFFAIVAPLGIAIGRVGCVLQGCCAGVACDRLHWVGQWSPSVSWLLVDDAHGVARWPAAQAELAFNVLFLGWVLAARRFGWCTGNRFHVYLIAYGAFRFMHEFLRDVPPLHRDALGALTGYQLVAIGMMVFGAVRYGQRRRAMNAMHDMHAALPAPPPSATGDAASTSDSHASEIAA
ncbi:MAG: prolipoprotein diacylglyceryl transferase family protein [Phycisphaerales bacterium]